MEIHRSIGYTSLITRAICSGAYIYDKNQALMKKVKDVFILGLERSATRVPTYTDVTSLIKFQVPIS